MTLFSSSYSCDESPLHSVEKQEILSHQKVFRQINSLVTYEVTTLLSRNICQKCVRMRENFRNFHTALVACISFMPVLHRIKDRTTLQCRGQNRASIKISSQSSLTSNKELQLAGASLFRPAYFQEYYKQAVSPLGSAHSLAVQLIGSNKCV